jgi:L-fucose isomerase-like protein
VVRGNYDFELTRALLPEIKRAAEAVGMEGIFPPADFGAGGLIRTDDDSAAYAAQWLPELADIRALVVFSGDFMQERRIMDAVRLLPPDVPIFVIVNNDNPSRMEGRDVGDSLCGSLSVHHNVRLLGRSVLRTARIDMHDAVLLADVLKEYDGLARGIEVLRNMRVALVGVNPDAFATTFSNQNVLFRLGFSLHTFELLDMWGDVVLGSALTGEEREWHGPFGGIRPGNPVRGDDPDVAAMLRRMERVPVGMPDDAHTAERIARCLVWIDRTFRGMRIDSGAIHCWGEFGRYFGMAPCAFAMFSNVLLGKPLVCEVDVCHAIMAGLGQELTHEPAVILDINNNGWDPCVFNVFHCSQTPPNWMAETGCIVAGGQVCGAMCEGPFTAVSAATSGDGMHATVFNGCFVPGEGGQRGSTGWAYVPNFPDVLRQIEQTGIHHFVAMKPIPGSDVADILRFRGVSVRDMTGPFPSPDDVPPMPEGVEGEPASGNPVFSR